MTDHIKKEPEDETIIDSAKIYDALRKNYFDRCLLSSYLDEKIDDNLHPFSDEAYNKMKFLHDEKDNLNFKNKMKEIKRNLSISQKKEIEKIMKNKIK
ncbi:hypothetical protein YH33_002577 [Salmonella enterica subsp. enterica serovar Mbandaka]|nr:hypothetical protein [Salmonella enterica subsp. enterica serovar Mbandaka]EDW2667427.1 hypothetical protein [Salmonella enterica subsp. enterica serovar Mbandaka]